MKPKSLVSKKKSSKKKNLKPKDEQEKAFIDLLVEIIANDIIKKNHGKETQ